MNTYQYRPLDAQQGEIRLFELLPGSFDDPIRIAIFTTPFIGPEIVRLNSGYLEYVQSTLPEKWRAHENLEGRILFLHSDGYSSYIHPTNMERSFYMLREPVEDVSDPEYEALSYVWGDSDVQHSVEVVGDTSIHGSGTSSTLAVGPNLLECLRYMRRASRSRVLWVDAICIDQSHSAEKSDQVRRMGDIYRCAQRVVVWLGPSSQHSAQGLRILSEAGDKLEATVQQRFMCAPNYKEYRPPASINGEPQMWEALIDIVCRPWWNRLWVVQEILLSTRGSAIVQCGEDTASWRRLRRGLIAFGTSGIPRNMTSAHEGKLDDCVALAMSTPNQHPLSLLDNTRHTQCSNPVDRVLGLLGLLPDVIKAKLKVSYYKSAHEMWRELCIAIIGESHSLDILSMSGPSWRSQCPHGRGVLILHHGHPWGHSVADASYPEPDLLKATGMDFDTIVAIGSLSRDSLEQVWLSRHQPDDEYPDGGSYLEACAWTITRGAITEQRPTLGNAVGLEDMVDALRKWICDNMDLNNIPEIVREFLALTTQHTIFRTYRGYIGMCYAEPSIGDKINVFLGSKSPFVLRPDDKGRHLFIGTAYVHGLMLGQGLLGPIPAQYQPQYVYEYPLLFIHRETGQKSFDDPRLGPLPQPWILKWNEDPLCTSRRVPVYINTDTGERLRSDPRLLPDAMRARGIQLESFILT